MKRHTLNKLDALCIYHGWRVALDLLTKVPDANTVDEAIDTLHALMKAEQNVLAAREAAGAPPE